MTGYAALNIMEGISENVQWYALSDELAKGKMLLDVRTREEVSRSHFANSINIPLDELRDRLAELDTNQEYIISCHSGLRSYIGERILSKMALRFKILTVLISFIVLSNQRRLFMIKTITARELQEKNKQKEAAFA